MDIFSTNSEIKSHDIFVSDFTRDLISNSLNSEYSGYFGGFHFFNGLYLR